jgi:heterotetrameric sarcosine oxidase gamma subunit
MTDLPSHARAVIIGGGVVGCSVAYHLARLGWRDIVLVERRQFACGTTWHAAGLIGQLRATQNLTRLAQYTQKLYAGLEAETGIATGLKQNGSLSVALTDERLEELHRGAAMARAFGLEVNVLSAEEAAARHPLLNPAGVVGGVFIPTDGQADPTNITQALARGARQAGARIVEGVKVTGIRVDGRRASAVETTLGTIECEHVVNCAGMWAREVGLMAGTAVPLHACEHFYVVTEQIPGLPSDLPVLRVPDECTYYKEDAGKLLVGAFEPEAKPWGMAGIPEDFAFDQLPEDIDHFAPILERAVTRVPVLEHTGIHTFFNGPESFTPDVRYLLGAAPERDNVWVAAGFNSIGIQSAGGAGKALAEWIDAGEPPFDLWDVDIRRMHPCQNNPAYLRARVSESLGLLYADHFPHRQYATARGLRRSPLHDRLAARGACFGEVAGWERPNWFLPEDARARGEKAEYRYSWKRQNWFAYARAEHLAVRERAGLFDLSSFAKFLVQGADAEAVLQRIAANDVAVAEGRIVYTQWLNARGGIEADLTITRLASDAFLVVTAAASAVRDLAWLRRHTPVEARCTIADVTAAEACIGIMGPESRALLARATSADLGNAAFPFGTARTIDLGMASARAHRISYAGELGWELYVPAEMALHVFDTLVEAGGDSLALCGMHALDSCRIEKAYRHFGHDIGDEDHVLEAGLGFAVKPDKPVSRFGTFIGREAVLERRIAGLGRRLLQFRLVDPDPLLHGNEPIYRDGRLAGYIASGAYGHALGAAIGLGYVACDEAETSGGVTSSRYEIDIAGNRVAAKAAHRPMHDPAGDRLRL